MELKTILPVWICSFSLLFNKCFAQQPRLMLPVGHSSYINYAEFSPNGKYVATASADNTIKVWDVISGRLITDLKGHTEAVNSAKFSPDGKKIVSSANDTTVKIWDVASGSLIADIKKSGAFAECSPDNKLVVTTSAADYSARIWDAVSGTLILNLKGHKKKVISADFSPDGKKIVTFSADNTAKIWDLSSGNLLITIIRPKGYVSSAEFSPDGEKIITIVWDGAAIWDAGSGKLLFDLLGHPECTSAQFSTDGKKIATVSASSARIWDANSGKLIFDSKIYGTDIATAQFSQDGNKLVTTSHSNNIARIRDIPTDIVTADLEAKIWDNTTGKRKMGYEEELVYRFPGRFSADGKKIITSSAGATATIWNTESGDALVELKGRTSYVHTSGFSPDGKKILTTSGNTAKIWDVNTGVLLANPGLYGGGARFSPDGKNILTIVEANAISWDATTGERISTMRNFTSRVTDAGYSPDGKKIVTGSEGGSVKIWDAQSGELLGKLNGYCGSVIKAIFSPDAQKILTLSANWIMTLSKRYDTAKIWDANTGELLFNLRGHTAHINNASFSSDGKRLLTSSLDNTAKIWDVNTGALLENLKKHTDFVESASFSPDGKKIITTSMDKTAKIWNANTGALLENIEGHTGWVSCSSFSPDGKMIVTASDDNTAKIWDATSGTLLADLKGHAWNVHDAFFSPDGKKVVTAAGDNICKLWNVETGKLLYSFFAIDDRDYFVYMSGGYYHSSPNAAKLLHYVTKDLKIISFEQLDVKYNRPDKILEAIGNSDTSLIRSYQKAYEKRIKKLAIDTTAFRDGYSVPEAEFANRDAIEYEQNTETLKLVIKGNDSTYKLDRFNVWVNEAPVFGQRGISLRKDSKNNLDTTITIKLSQGENRIETSIINLNGTESYRMPLIVNYSPAVNQREMIRFIGIGIDKFNNNKYNLQYSTKDIRDLSKKLKEKYGNDIIIDTLFNQNVTVSNIKALKKKLQQTTHNDKVIVAYSGHGMLSKDYEYYLSTYAVNFDKPEQNGLPYDELENLLDSIPARKKLMLIDACHSGEVDKDDLITLNASSDSLIKGLKPVAYKKEGHLGLKNSFELMQSLFVNVGKSTGATIISAAAGTQFALERNDLKNGVFTYSILEAMNKYPTLKISELKKIVGDRVEQLTKGLQKPTSRNETIAVDWNVW